MFSVRSADLRAVNSLTKYPSIQTYHRLDPANGGLLEEAVAFPGEVVATEKVDGTNSRIVLLPDGTYLLGSREELLYAQGDLIGNPALNIVDNLRPVADALPGVGERSDLVQVYFLELYGGKIGGAARQYTDDPARFGWRLFDVALIDGWADRLALPAQQLAAWREDGGQPFADEDQLGKLAGACGLELTPRLARTGGDALPTDIAGMHRFLTATLPATAVALHEAPGRAEGVVFRSPDRSVIAKARFQDYERTLRRRAGKR